MFGEVRITLLKPELKKLKQAMDVLNGIGLANMPIGVRATSVAASIKSILDDVQGVKNVVAGEDPSEARSEDTQVLSRVTA